MLNLASETREGWVDHIWPHIDTILVDHAHCEKKAAGSAVNLLFRYPHVDAVLRPLSALAREELEHFDLVLDLLKERGIPFAKLEPSPYASRLRKALRPTEPDRLIDTLLICAVIEARSCERMKLLSEQLPDARLAAFYGELLESEARHFSTYVHMAEALAPREVVLARLREIAAHEASVIAEAPDTPRLHN